MYTTLNISSDLNRAIMLRSHHNRGVTRKRATYTGNRELSQFGTKAYNDSLQRAFTRAKMQIFFNPDMTHFITLTYKQQDNTVEQVQHDMKMFLKRTARRARAEAGSVARSKPKYIYIMEHQKRGSIHVHMIANDCFFLQVNKNGYRELEDWPHGFTSVLTINDFDQNFRPYLYLFKYMKKSQRIGNSFVHTSRNLNNYTNISDEEINIAHWRTLTMEHTQTTISTTNFQYYRNYLQFDDTINSHNQVNPFERGTEQWHEQVKLHSTRVLEKLLANHTQHSKSK